MNQGILIFCPLLLKMNEVTRAKGIIHKARVSFIVVATFGASSPYAAPAPHYRTRIMYGNGRPCAELMLAHVQSVAYHRENKQCNGIQYKDGAQCHRHLAILCLQHRPHSRNGTASADSRTGTDKIGSVTVHF